MRIKTFTQGGYTDGGFTSGGGTMTGPLILSGEPTKELEAATKQYADTKTASFDASKFTSGTLQVGRLPAFTGDVVSSTGSNSLSLAPTGVGAGVYNKVTVNAKGLITGGAGLTEADIPDLDWAKITSGKPNTLVGYGITDAVSKAGGTITGMLTLHADPTNANHLATKQYVDNSAGGASALKTGDIISKLTSTTPNGFLKCNGGEVSKAAYSALYAAVGDAFSIYSNANVSNGQPWMNQYNINTTQTDDVTGWTATTNGPYTATDMTVFVTKNRVYVVGGQSNISNSFISAVCTAPINADGTLGAWSNVSAGFPYSIAQTCVAVIKNRVYIFGGQTGNTYPTNTQKFVYSAVINADGTIGAWTDTNNPFPDYCSMSSVVVTKNRVYVLSGSNYSQSGNVFVTTINADGTLNAWNVQTGMNVPTTRMQVVLTKDRVYAFTSAGIAYTATINSDGTLNAFTTVPSLNIPNATGYSAIVVTKKRVYSIGGYVTSGSPTADIYTTTINADGTLGGWFANAATLPSSKHGSACFVTSNKIYLISGSAGNGNATNVSYVANFVGGQNDYSSYNSGTVLPTNTANFRLPDTTTSDPTGSYSYIKT